MFIVIVAGSGCQYKDHGLVGYDGVCCAGCVSVRVKPAVKISLLKKKVCRTRGCQHAIISGAHTPTVILRF